ncbi:tyrosine-type recombinase/integrase [Lignipirellula cremea]|uniref:tyrosine-type recombinase/integrase n=1 Tax=Lignipirellula cremea TaxID=2528010 RepID=UPI003703ED5C
MLASKAETTVRREVKRAKRFFCAALRKQLISENPFADLPCPAQVNKSRLSFVTEEITQQVLAHCPDTEWRLIFALSRYGALRCPSEHLSLTWADVDWERERITIRARKTEHHRSGGVRQIPLFPELKPHLEDAWQLAEEGQEHIIVRYRKRNANLRTQLCRIIKRAGLDQWPRLFHNLRTTRETELADHFPPHVVCYWVDNSEKVAQDHYLQVTTDHCERALKSGAIPVQKAVQQPAASSRTAQQKTPQPLKDCGVMLNLADACEKTRDARVPPRGVEPLFSD